MSALAQFKLLFTGRDSCYGVHVPDKSPHVEGEKRKGSSYTEKTAITDEVYEEHIKGTKSIGIVPLTGDNKVWFAAIDIDVYPLDPRRFCFFFAEYSLPFTVFKSKSGGAHAFIFFAKETEARAVIQQLERTVSLLGLPKDTEIFPKQASTEAIGNWINLPYFDAYNTTRYAYDDEGNPLGFEEAMELAWSRRTSVGALKEALTRMPFSEAPPCLQRLYLSGLVTEENHNRNKFLFNTCVYLKSRNPDDYEERLKAVNNSLATPMDELELERTVLHSFINGDYSYQCDEPWLADFCNKAVCAKRKFGKSSTYVSDFSFEGLRQVESDPPYYVWKINGQDMTFYSEAELRKQDRFADYCVRYLHRCPNRLKESIWIEILNKALSNIEIVKLDNGDEMLSETEILKQHLREFLMERQLAQAPGQVLMGQAYFDEDLGYCFRPTDFMGFLEYIKRYKIGGTNRLHQQLKNYGAYATKLYNPLTKKAFRVWAIHQQALEEAPCDFEGTSPAATPAPTLQEKRPSASPQGGRPLTAAEKLRRMALQREDVEDDETVPALKFEQEQGDF